MVLVVPNAHIGELVLFHPEMKAITEIQKGTQGRNLNSSCELLNEIILFEAIGGSCWLLFKIPIYLSYHLE